MSNQVLAPLDAVPDARARLDDLAQLYAGLRQLLLVQISAAQADPALSAKALIARLGELQTAHLMLTKAEEKFHDAFGTEDDTPTDIDSLRAEIGRKLDRIRKAQDAKAVPDGAE